MGERKADIGIKSKIIRYEQLYFKDFTLKDKHIRQKFKHAWNDIPSISFKDWKTKKKIDSRFGSNNLGFCYSDKRTLQFNMATLKKLPQHRLKEVILHEMIHGYEEEFNKIRKDKFDGENVEYFLLSYLTLNLEENIGENFNKIFDLVTDSRFWIKGHSLLFVLKTFDLDLKLNKDLGTILGFDRVDYLDSVNCNNIEKLLEDIWEMEPDS